MACGSGTTMETASPSRSSADSIMIDLSFHSSVPDRACDATNTIFEHDQPLSNNISTKTLLPDTVASPHAWEQLDQQPYPFFSAPRSALDKDTYSSAIEKTTYLTERISFDSIANHNADCIVRTLCAMPDQMLRRETFPCFIHPQWDRKALPEPLAVCVRIAKMFASRTPEIIPFIWRTILAETRRAVAMVHEMSLLDLLATQQAGMVYMIMRKIEDPVEDVEWNREMTSAVSTICNRFVDSLDGSFCQAEKIHPSQTWTDWIFAESRRRTSAVWFLLAKSVFVKTRAGCDATEAPWTLPLPCPRQQWEARTCEAWSEEMGAAQPDQLSTFGGLVVAKTQTGHKQNARALNSWNASADGLGLLLNLAAGTM
ncbi:hypothetical protein LTR78_001714 [Recurvomyces mirabilis]|uniref:Uncharacterized protein n=1 Tax=Recurvomyces mirabilis TaxID=574656 RepID=A0AAE0WUK3_9PEZI|nr:hypothetical protein LTR78_001714 [Recurvomyces mirabilis]KAK5150211.1 hypothetical protein LTS14_010340 [Recurvomyces mirabilis]